MGIVGGIGRGSFQLFVQSNGSDGIYADAAARDVYFGANPSELARLDANEFLIIKLDDDGFGFVAYQQRSGGNWLDVTSLVQGETGPAGATGNSFFFTSIAERDTFFNTSPNEGLLENGLPIAVNIGDDTTSQFVWGGGTSPPSYDDTLWRLAAIEVSSGTLFLGESGSNISSGNEVLNFISADSVNHYVHGIQYSDSGSLQPNYWKLPAISQIPLADVSTSILADPQTLSTTNTIDVYVKEYTLIPAASGELRVQTWLGTDETGPSIVDTFIIVDPGDVGNQTVFVAPNNTLVLVGQQTYTKFSGVQLRGGLQTLPPFLGQTVPFVTLGGWVAENFEFVTQFNNLLSLKSPSGSGTASIEFTNSSDVLKGSIVYDETGDTFTIDAPDTGIVEITPFIKFIEGVSDARIDIEPVTGTGSSIITLSNQGGGSALTLDHDDTTDSSLISGSIGDLIIETTSDQDITIKIGGATSALSIENALSPDTNALTNYTTGGANGVSVADFYGGRDPNSNVTGLPGDLYRRKDGNSSTIYIHEGTASSNTDWKNVLTASSGIVGPSTSTNNSIPTWSGTGGDALLDNPFFTATDDGSILTLSFQISAAGRDAKIEFKDETATIQAEIFYDNSLDKLLIDTNTGTDIVIDSGGSIEFDSTSGMSFNSGSGLNMDAATDINIRTANGDLDLRTLVDGDKIVIDASQSAVTSSVFQLENLTTSVNFFVSSASPEGVITGDPGDICYVINGLNSRTYQLESASSGNTGWEVNQGNVDGPATSTNNSIPSWNGTGGDSLRDNAELTYLAAGNARSLQIESPNASGNISLDFLDSGSLSATLFSFSEASGDFVINHTTGRLVLSSAVDDVEINLTAAASSLFVDGQGHTDSDEILKLDTGGANGAVTNIHSGNRNPEGLVTSTPGAIYFRRNGTSSSAYQLKSASSANTPWIDISSGIVGPGTVADNSLITFDGTTGNLVQEVAGATLTSDGTAVDLTFQGSSVSTDNNIQFNDSLGATAFQINRAGNTSSTDLINTIGALNITQSTGQPLNITTATTGINITAALGVGTVINTDFRITRTAGAMRIRPRSPSGTGISEMCLENSSAADALRIQYDETSDSSSIVNSFGELTISSTPATGDIVLNTSGTDSDIRITVDDGDIIINATGSGTEGGVLVQADEEVVIQSDTSFVQITAGTAVTDRVLELTALAAARVSHVYLTDDDPNGVITDEGGGLAIRDQGTLSRLYLNKAATTSSVWNTFAINSIDEFDIFDSGDLDDLASGGIITVASPTTLNIKGDSIISTDVVFVLTTGNLAINGVGQTGNHLNYTGTGDFFTVTDPDLFISPSSLNITASGGGTLLNANCDIVEQPTGAFNPTQTTFAGWNLGKMENWNFIPTNMLYFTILSPLTLTNSSLVSSGYQIQLSTVTRLFDFDWDGSNPFAQTIILRNLASLVTDSPIRIDPYVNPLASFHFTDTTTRDENVPIFDETGDTGNFTVVADASETATNITGVNDNGGIASFLFSGPTLHVNQEVINSTFSESTYNGTFIITATNGTSTFEVAKIAFAGADTGSFLSNSVTFTDSGTTLTNGDTVTIDTELSTDYDGGGIVYNQLTNSFQLNRTFTATRLGTWSEKGLNEINPQVLVSGAQKNPDSHYIATAYVNNNTTGNATIENNEFIDMSFGTVGDALIPGSTMERWKLIDEVNGTFKYIGNEPFDGYVTFDISSASSSGTLEFRYKWMISTDTTITASTIAFVDSNPDTITDTGNGFLTAGFKPEDRISVSGSTSNDGDYKIDTVTVGTITLVPSDTLVAEPLGDTVTINSTFTNLPDAVEAISAIPSTERAVTKTIPLRANKGERIKPQITRNSGSSGIVHSYVTFYATQ